jgi:hypothetical protein
MIQPLRVVHRRAFAALGLVLPAILLIGLEARRPHLGPSAHVPDVLDTGSMVRELSNLWQKHSIRSRFYSRPDRPLDTYVVLLPAQEWNEPDLLLYWATNTAQENVLPGGAQLMGTFRTGKAFLLPVNRTGAGHLVLFSPAHQAVFDTARVEKLP